MPIIISETYEIVTPESAECGDIADSGFCYQAEPYTFRELVEYIRFNGFYNPSDSHGIPRWLSNEGDTDYCTGEREIRSIHPGRDTISQKYWRKAVNYALSRAKNKRSDSETAHYRAC